MIERERHCRVSFDKTNEMAAKPDERKGVGFVNPRNGLQARPSRGPRRRCNRLSGADRGRIFRLASRLGSSASSSSSRCAPYYVQPLRLGVEAQWGRRMGKEMQ